MNNDLFLEKMILTDWDGIDFEKPKKRLEFIPWNSVLNEPENTYSAPNIADVNPAYILHTSGSTGAPKGVAISHLNSLTFVNMAADYFGINNLDRMASFAPLHFDLSVFDIFTAVKQGAAIVLVPEQLALFPIRLTEYIDKQRITVWNSASSVLILLVDRGKIEKGNFESLRLVHFSGDILPPKYLRELKSHMKNADFFNIYGQTEANSSMGYHIDTVSSDDMWKIPIGKPFPNFEVFAVNEDGREVTASDQEGELYIKSSTVAIGYWNDRERTDERFTSNPLDPSDASRCYKTGDIVRIDGEGNFVFVGRKDSMVKSRGYRIELNEIEIVLSSHPSVRQAVAIAVPDEKIGNRVVGYASLVEGETLPENDLIHFCQDRLPKYMVPQSIKYLRHLPMTSSGKIDRKSIEKEALGTE
jgi:amino acid adenylation domain-containing protein